MQVLGVVVASTLLVKSISRMPSVFTLYHFFRFQLNKRGSQATKQEAIILPRRNQPLRSAARRGQSTLPYFRFIFLFVFVVRDFSTLVFGAAATVWSDRQDVSFVLFCFVCILYFFLYSKRAGIFFIFFSFVLSSSSSKTSVYLWVLRVSDSVTKFIFLNSYSVGDTLLKYLAVS